MNDAIPASRLRELFVYNPLTGRARGSAPDIEHKWYSIEVKHRKQFPSWLHDAMDQAKASKVEESQLSMVVLHEKGTPYREAMCIVPLGEFTSWFGDVKARGGGDE